MSPQRPPVHPAVVAAQASFHPDLIEEVARAISENDIVVVGVKGLQPGSVARKLLDQRGAKYKYLEYGSYFAGWRRRLALKMWLGWPTFPLVFVKGTFIGGASDLRKLLESGGLVVSASEIQLKTAHAPT